MFPSFPSKNIVNCCNAYRKSFSHVFGLLNVFQRPYFQNIFFCKFRHSVRFTLEYGFRLCNASVSISDRRIASPFFNFVGIVFGNCPKKQVKRVDARWIVASMANAKSFFNSSVVKHVGNSMCFKHFPICSASPAYAHHSIASWKPCASPIPAIKIIFFIDVIKKSLGFFFCKFIYKFTVLCKNFFSVINHSRFMVLMLESRLAVTSATCFILPNAV